MTDIGILAYGSLISDPSTEIGPLIERRIPTITPFPVEYARLSRTRGGSPTVVPHTSGKPVKAEILVLSDSVHIDEARNLLWRRETRKVGSGRAYPKGTSPNAVVIRDEPGFCEVGHVLYTDFHPGGKLKDPDPRQLAEAAINSVSKASLGMDGISYLMSLINVGAETELTQRYMEQLLILTGAASLSDALDLLSSKTHRGNGGGQG